MQTPGSGIWILPWSWASLGDQRWCWDQCGGPGVTGMGHSWYLGVPSPPLRFRASTQTHIHAGPGRVLLRPHPAVLVALRRFQQPVDAFHGPQLELHVRLWFLTIQLR